MAVLINGRTAVHKDSNGTLTTIDPCYTGPQQQIVNYQNVAKSRDATNTAKTVFINGNPVCHKESYFARSYGSEAGDGGGVISKSRCGKAEFVTASENVFIEGIAAVRQGDLMVSNNRNTQPAPLRQPGVPYQGDQEKINQFPKIPYTDVKIDLIDFSFTLPPVYQNNSIYTFTVKLDGNFTLKKQGEFNILSFDPTGYQLEAKQELGQYFNGLTLLSIDNKAARIGNAIAGDFWLTYMGFEPPNKHIFSASPQKVQTMNQNGFFQIIVGECSLTLIVEQNPNSQPFIKPDNNEIVLLGENFIQAIIEFAETILILATTS
jgi:hypothetical protein